MIFCKRAEIEVKDLDRVIEFAYLEHKTNIIGVLRDIN
jgi:hypothetical protein